METSYRKKYNLKIYKNYQKLCRRFQHVEMDHTSRLASLHFPSLSSQVGAIL